MSHKAHGNRISKVEQHFQKFAGSRLWIHGVVCFHPQPPVVLRVLTYAITRSAAAASVATKKRLCVSVTRGPQGSICLGVTGKWTVGPAASA
jgi:hypothetical protein